MKVKIYLLLEDKGIKGLDLSKPENGNPGIGGTQFLFVALANELSKYSDFDVNIIHYREQKLPANVQSVLIDSDIFEVLEKDRPDIFLFHPNKDKEWYQRLNTVNVTSVAWVHNYISYKDATILSKCQNIKAVVFVGKQQYDRYIDHKIIEKSCYIYNFIFNSPTHRKKEYQPWVTYIGSLTYPKGFHWISECWKKVVEQVPDAELHVIGSGNLYSRDSKIGNYGIASEEYEKIIMPGLVDSTGQILNSVKFHGNLGSEKYYIFENTAVGIINPSGETETFGLGAVEMQQVGIPVISRKKFGLLDTVDNNRTGILINNTSELEKAIVMLLNDKKKNYEYGCAASKFVDEKFSKEKIIFSWRELMQSIFVNGRFEPHIIYPSDNLKIDLKWARLVVANMKKFTIFKCLPSVGEVCEYIREIRFK